MKDYFIQEDFLTPCWGQVQIRVFKTKSLIEIRTIVNLSTRRKIHHELVIDEIDIGDNDG